MVQAICPEGQLHLGWEHLRLPGVLLPLPSSCDGPAQLGPVCSSLAESGRGGQSHWPPVFSISPSHLPGEEGTDEEF